MKTIVFDSPWQHEVRHAESGIVFQRDVPREVEDDVADQLLGLAPGTRAHPHFREPGSFKGGLGDEVHASKPFPESAPTYSDFHGSVEEHDS